MKADPLFSTLDFSHVNRVQTGLFRQCFLTQSRQNLTSPVDSVISKAQGAGTIFNDDAVAGRLDHFAWAPVFSPQKINRPIPVQLTALDAFGDAFTNYVGSVLLLGTAAGGATNLGVVWFPQPETNDVVVRLSSGDSNAVAVSPEIVISMGSTSDV
jgi:hypothetical protein